MGVLDDIKSQYPTLAFLINDPEIGPLLRAAVDPNKGFDPGTFQAKLYQTKWFKTRSTSQRQYDILKNTDPGEFKRRSQEALSKAHLTAQKLGLRMSSNELKYLSGTMLRNGADIGSEEFVNTLRNFAQATTSNRMGEGSIRGAAYQINDVARNQYFIPLSSKDAYAYGIDLALGVKDENSIRAIMAERAASLYPHLKEMLQGGQSMEDIFSGHRAVISQELELAPETIDFTKDWKKVLYQVDPQTQKPRPMTLHEAQTMARQDNRWWATTNGKEADAGMGNFLLKTFGKRA